ncbi:GntR family transcriptional regulator [Phycicoccus sp. Root563]|uniref:GntR family transcriptional regulator n=1 Tax=Phycicoccus sp. Root563 TaxID=1736562 RepID=UPI00070370FD|nr:GntR family transcriptional regulator [Phycicoccus sp. Root563]KQZ90257.1 GntR family transcriptional regulator [Phycicoccus sp. Root563]
MLDLGQVDKTADTPAFKQIAQGIREAVSLGRLQPGDQVPSEAQLMEQFGVARMTVRQALADLRAEGLLRAEHGRGVFVRDRPVVRRVASDRFARRHRDQGQAAFLAEAEGVGAPSVDEIEVGSEVASTDVREALGLTSRAKVVARRRRYLMDGQPVELAQSFVPHAIANGTKIADADTGPGGIYARLEELGHELAEFSEEVAARMPSPEERRRLRLPTGTPVLTVRRIAFDREGAAVELTDAVRAAPSYVLEYRFPAV